MLESGSWGHSVLQTPALVFFFMGFGCWGGGGGGGGDDGEGPGATSTSPKLDHFF